MHFVRVVVAKASLLAESLFGHRFGYVCCFEAQACAEDMRATRTTRRHESIRPCLKILKDFYEAWFGGRRENNCWLGCPVFLSVLGFSYKRFGLKRMFVNVEFEFDAWTMTGICPLSCFPPRAKVGDPTVRAWTRDHVAQMRLRHNITIGPYKYRPAAPSPVDCLTHAKIPADYLTAIKEMGIETPTPIQMQASRLPTFEFVDIVYLRHYL